jgi:hypothetical protein
MEPYTYFQEDKMIQLEKDIKEFSIYFKSSLDPS